jgi:hypothetical protein
LLRHLRGPLVFLLDNSSTHKGEPIEQLLGHIAAFASSTFLRMLRNSIPMKESGLWQNGNWPTAAPTM